MPFAPKHPCTWPGCKELVKDGSRCEKHKRQQQREIDQRRGSAAKRGYDATWRPGRAAYLVDHRFCVICDRAGIVEPATEVDHIKPHHGDPELMWNTDNWQALCKRCHSKKTAKEDGRWSRKSR